MLALAALLLALASPAPQPQPTNPFNLNPIPAPSGGTLPIIGTTRTRAICSALRKAVAPAIVAAMKNDKSYAGFRVNLRDYIIYGTETSRDLKLMQMDRSIDAAVKSTDDLETALNSHDFDAPPNSSAKDAAALDAIRQSMRGVLAAQKVQLDAMSGWLETERMSRFGKLSESEQNMQNAVSPNTTTSTQGQPAVNATPDPGHAFLRDSSMIMKLPMGQISLDDARNLDRDLGDIAAYTSKREDYASKVIIPATEICK